MKKIIAGVTATLQGGGRSFVVMVLCFAAAFSAAAREIVLSSSSPANWNTDAANMVWTNSAGEFVAFQNGDNVLISSQSFAGSSLMMTERVTPGDVVFDIDKTLLFGWGNDRTYGLSVDTRSFTKRGKATLILTSALSGSAVHAGGNTDYGNAMTCGVEIVEGEIACKDRNSHNFLGPRTVPFGVHIHDGASLTFLQGNQTGTYTASESGIKIQLDAGARLNHATNAVTTRITSVLCVNTLKLCGGDIINGDRAYIDTSDASEIGAGAPAHLGSGNCMMKIYNTLHFSGATPHAFGFSDEYSGYKSYSLDGSLKNCKVSLHSKSPVEFRVDDIDGGEGVDAYVNMLAFTWGTNSTLKQCRSDLVKTGAGTLCFPSNNCFTAFKGDFTVKEGTVVFKSLSSAQNFFVATETDPLQTITISTNATMRVEKRNITRAGGANVSNIKFVIDHGKLEYSTSGANAGSIIAKDWVFDDATLDIHNKGMNEYFGIFDFKNSVTFRGTKPLVMRPDETLNTSYQAVTVHDGSRTNGSEDGPITTIDVADMTGDGRTDVEMGYHIWNAATGSEPRYVLQNSGFIKKGAGTFSVASMTNKVSGRVIVSNGTLRVDGKLVTPSSVEVAEGAYIGGTGTVAHVVLDAGAGFAAPAGQRTPLTVEGDLALPAIGSVNISNLDGLEVKKLPGATLLTVTGTLAGIANLGAWKVHVDGVAQGGSWRVVAEGKVVKVKRYCGMRISIK